MTEKSAEFSLPVTISSSALLNAVVRGAEKAALELGDDYYALVRKEFLALIVGVYRRAAREKVDALESTQTIVHSESPIWSMKLDSRVLRKDTDEPFFKAHTPRYFFLTRAEALAYLDSIETAAVNHIRSLNKTEEG